MPLNQFQEKVGIVTDEEKNEVLCLYERHMGLKELLPVLQSNDQDNTLYDRVIQDLGATTRLQQQWWTRMANKYNWKGKEGASWNINFEDNSIYLNDISSIPA
jgi:CXXX repeat modification system protein